VAQDFYDILQPFDYIVDLLDSNKAQLGLRYIAQNDENLIPQYPAVLVQTDRVAREFHATQQFLVRFFIDLWVFHAELSSSAAVRSRKDIELAQAIRKLLHTDRSLGGHIVHGFVSGEHPGVVARVIDSNMVGIVTTRLTWEGENRVNYQDS
jgi:hypothetical protein